MWLFAMFANNDPNSWKEVFFDDWGSLLKHLRKIDECKVPIDSMQWVFVTYFLEANR
jgi:hypothetical protein